MHLQKLHNSPGMLFAPVAAPKHDAITLPSMGHQSHMTASGYHQRHSSLSAPWSRTSDATTVPMSRTMSDHSSEFDVASFASSSSGSPKSITGHPFSPQNTQLPMPPVGTSSLDGYYGSHVNSSIPNPVWTTPVGEYPPAPDQWRFSDAQYGRPPMTGPYGNHIPQPFPHMAYRQPAADFSGHPQGADPSAYRYSWPAHSSSHIPPSGNVVAPSEAALSPSSSSGKSSPTGPRQRSRELRFECDFPGCKRKFPFAAHLERHRRHHTGEKPFQCGICGACFSRKDNARLHVKIHTRNMPWTDTHVHIIEQ
ncbi:hypothetical protein M427DRAFT_56855 [Gonapodya prolifera JEL478]|uniref:C2H2-type domain-containing protein n=1 Tax=Gonapodya prolifera (strain JEL478) TaxID=1344416 RepID=A0A139AEP0_GONPJ|nr:hypothetical protein M427DRAFT_56855 [Gonapodya prolifera JEL478]|eukprot:KXS15228.1 hypothetical protein M427DRAFT_56855 [Gonapodya prolifera JEL478]